MTHSNFSLQFLGSGNARTKPPANYNTCAIIRSSTHTWLLDCGLLTPLAMHHFQIPLSSIDGVFVSHLHGDHVLGLEELCLTRYFSKPRTKIDLFLPSGMRRETGAPEGYDIWENCLRASLETNVPTDSGYRLLSLSDYANIHTLYPNQTIQIYDLPCEPFHVEHVLDRPSYGLIIGSRIAYTSDCTFSLQRIQSLLNQNIEIIFHDVCFTSGCDINAVHTSFEQLSNLPRQIAEHIVLMHYGDDTTEEQFKIAQSLGFRIAKPGMIFNF